MYRELRRATFVRGTDVLLPWDEGDGERCWMAPKEAVNLANLEVLGAKVKDLKLARR